MHQRVFWHEGGANSQTILHLLSIPSDLRRKGVGHKGADKRNRTLGRKDIWALGRKGAET